MATVVIPQRNLKQLCFLPSVKSSDQLVMRNDVKYVWKQIASVQKRQR